ncbi:MAG: type II toxin-antitoxin system RelE/ParE family toxin [Candidatus Aminicenantes bacterium]|nr:type II toxin-antitoxin system RelE/ParE family toxin [Candidatus Aminicenantes bacterium]
MSYAVFYEEKAAKELAKIERPYQLLIKKKIELLAEDFASMANNLKPLKEKYDYYRLRVGRYRVLFHKDARKIMITIVRVGYRREVYKDL